jgi:hypothetical protein
MGRRAKGWLLGGWLVLVVGGWSFTESINDGIEPTSGPRPKPSSSASPAGCPAPTPASPAEATHEAADFHAEAEVRPGTATAIVCTTSD